MGSLGYRHSCMKPNSWLGKISSISWPAAPEASWLELRDQALRLSGPHDTVPRGRLTLAGAHRPSVVFLKLSKPALCVCFSLCVVRRVRGGADERERRWC